MRLSKIMIYLIILGIIIICILLFGLYIYLVYGTETLYLLFVGALVVIAFLAFIYIDAKYPRRTNREDTLSRAEREKAYQQELGRSYAQEDIKRRKEWEQNERKRQREHNDILRKIFR